MEGLPMTSHFFIFKKPPVLLTYWLCIYKSLIKNLKMSIKESVVEAVLEFYIDRMRGNNLAVGKDRY